MHLLCATYAPICLKKTTELFDFSVSLHSVIQVSIDSTSHNASMSLIQYMVSLQFGCTVTNLKNFSKSKKHIRMGILVLKDHKSHLLLLNKVFHIPNLREKMGNKSVSYSCQLKIMHFFCS